MAPSNSRCVQPRSVGNDQFDEGGVGRPLRRVAYSSTLQTLICRIKDVIKTGGECISSLELENLISRHPAVSEVAVIGVKDPKWVERPLALIVLKPEHAGQVDKAEIQRHVKGFADKGLISKYAAPQTVIFVEALAKTRVGKTNKKELREKYQHAAA